MDLEVPTCSQSLLLSKIPPRIQLSTAILSASPCFRSISFLKIQGPQTAFVMAYTEPVPVLRTPAALEIFTSQLCLKNWVYPKSTGKFIWGVLKSMGIPMFQYVSILSHGHPWRLDDLGVPPWLRKHPYYFWENLETCPFGSIWQIYPHFQTHPHCMVDHIPGACSSDSEW